MVGKKEIDNNESQVHITLSLNMFRVLFPLLANKSKNEYAHERINPLSTENNVFGSRFKSSKNGRILSIYTIIKIWENI